MAPRSTPRQKSPVPRPRKRCRWGNSSYLSTSVATASGVPSVTPVAIIARPVKRRGKAKDPPVPCQVDSRRAASKSTSVAAERASGSGSARSAYAGEPQSR